jgi:myo-inositol-hexaphosphate 3-phosphohydrolase
VQNAPNPFSANTIIKCYVPSSVKQAQLVIYGMNGQLLKSYKLSTGLNNVNMIAGSLASGQYRYSLMTDGKTVDTKSMVITK